MSRAILSVSFVLICSFQQQVLAEYIKITPTIIRGHRPTELELRKFKQIGLKTIINLDDNWVAIQNEKRFADQLGIHMISMPMSPWAKPDNVQIDRILSLLKDNQNQPLLIHCQFGRDRTGLVSALYRVLVQGWPAQKAYDEMMSLGFRVFFINMRNYFWSKVKTNPKEKWINFYEKEFIYEGYLQDGISI